MNDREIGDARAASWRERFPVTRCTHLSRQGDEPVAASLSNLGAIARRRGDYDRAAGYLEGALTVARETGTEETTARVLAQRAALERARGDHAAATEYVERATEAARESDDAALAVFCLATGARLAFEAGDVEAGIAAGDAAVDRVEAPAFGAADPTLAPLDALRGAVAAARDVGVDDPTLAWCRATRDALEAAPLPADDHRSWFDRQCDRLGSSGSDA